ncbi:MAG: hypothetical protein H7061_03860 [Bdellovibrionaceae bacterium]|nr:hypothetical protein [Bdellovibrio sp.]
MKLNLFISALLISFSAQHATANEASFGPGETSKDNYRWTSYAIFFAGPVEKFDYAQPKAPCNESNFGALMALNIGGGKKQNIVCVGGRKNPADAIDKLLAAHKANNIPTTEVAVKPTTFSWILSSAGAPGQICSSPSTLCNQNYVGTKVGTAPCTVFVCAETKGGPVTAEQSTPTVTPSVAPTAAPPASSPSAAPVQFAGVQGPSFGPGDAGRPAKTFYWTRPQVFLNGPIQYFDYEQPQAACNPNKVGSLMAVDTGGPAKINIVCISSETNIADYVENVLKTDPNSLPYEVAKTKTVYKWVLAEETPQVEGEMRFCSSPSTLCNKAYLGQKIGKAPCTVFQCARIDGSSSKIAGKDKKTEDNKELEGAESGAIDKAINKAIDNVNRNLEAAKAASEKAAAAERAPATAPEKPYNERSHSELNTDSNGDQ